MIQISNQICCSFSIGDVTDFIDADNLESFELHEHAGGLRPIIKIKFKVDNEDVIKYLNPGNILSVSFGITELSKDVMQFELYGDETNPQYNFGYSVEISGAFYNPLFTSWQGCKYFSGTSLDVFNKVATDNGFKLITNISKANDKMDWYQVGTTTWDYMKTVWLHSYIDDTTFQVYGFDAYNIYFYDMKQLVLQDATWIFSSQKVGNETSNLVNFGYYTTENNYGSLNQLAGQNMINKTYNSDDNTFVTDTYNLKNFTTIDSNNLNINSTNKRSFNYFIMTEDYHANYVKAYNQNLRNNLMYSSFNIYISTAAQFKKFKLFDTVIFDIAPNDTRLEGTSFITGIVYQYQNQNMTINLTLNKEAPSGIKGTDLQVGG